MHIHSKYSWDSSMDLETIANILIEEGIEYAAITDHVEFDRESLNFVLSKFLIRHQEINQINEKYEGKLKLLKAVEISEPHWYKEQVKWLIEKREFDFIMGSIHCYPKIAEKANHEIGTYLYYREMLKMVEENQIDVVGHLDYINRYYKTDVSDPKQVDEVLLAIKEHKQIIEINTSAKRRAQLELFPSKDKITRYKLLGGNYVIVGTDAHRENELVDNLEQAEDISRKTGLEPVTFEKRKRMVL